MADLSLEDFTQEELASLSEEEIDSLAERLASQEDSSGDRDLSSLSRSFGGSSDEPSYISDSSGQILPSDLTRPSGAPILPTLGAIGGGLAGSLAGPIGMAAGATLGESGGKGLERWIAGEPGVFGEELLSLNPLENPAILNFAIPGALGAISKGTKALGRGARRMAQMAEESVFEVPTALKKKEIAKGLQEVTEETGAITLKTDIQKALDASKQEGIFSGRIDPERIEFARASKVQELSAQLEEELDVLDRAVGIHSGRLLGERVLPSLDGASEYVSTYRASPGAKIELQKRLNEWRELIGQSWDGSLSDLHRFKKEVYEKINYKRLEDPNLIEQEKAVLDSLVAKGLKETIEQEADRLIQDPVKKDLVKNLNERLSNLLQIKPITVAAAAQKPTLQQMMATGASAVVGSGLGPLGTLGGGLGAYLAQTPQGRLLGRNLLEEVANRTPGIASLLEKGSLPLMGASAAGRNLPVNQETPEGLRNLLEQGGGGGGGGPTLPTEVPLSIEELPRMSGGWTPEVVSSFAQKMIGGGKEEVGKGLILKMVEAQRSQDFGKMQKLVADAAKLFPEYFERGVGIDGKIFHKEDQAEYISQLERAVKKGVLDSTFLGRQMNAFSDPNDSSVLSMPVQDRAGSPARRMLQAVPRPLPY